MAPIPACTKNSVPIRAASPGTSRIRRREPRSPAWAVPAGWGAGGLKSSCTRSSTAIPAQTSSTPVKPKATG